LTLALLTGCDGGPPVPKPGPATPHNGTLVSLPEDGGFVEIVKEPDSGKKDRAKILAYFLDSSRNPITTVSAVTLKSKATGNKPIELKPTGDADPAKAGGMATPSLPDVGEIDGELTATIAGKPVTIPLNVR